MGTIRAPIGQALSAMVVTYLLTLGGVYILALIIDALAPNFHGTKNQLQALKVAAYSSTASWVSGIFSLIASLQVFSEPTTLRDRGIQVHPRDRDEDLADLLDSVERFEVVVESHGGDLLVDRIGSSEPDDPAFVLPVRTLDESVTDYRLRVEAATDRLRHHRQA